ncbi:MAG: elongation factor 4 [Patescibacteria group bacterium]|nr:MAG: elongation factor 4 [Patescibacteria group bacterium]
MSVEIRNFAIIAHIDHGKSTLADRLLELSGVLKPGQHQQQFLDANPISRERGITIKLAPVSFNFAGIRFNLIDTPGHVDFHYEVDRTLACVESVILLVSAVEGIQAQTVSNAYKALEKDLFILPAINKIDAANANIEMVENQLKHFFGFRSDEIFKISAKTGQNVDKLLSSLPQLFPAPKIIEQNDFKALIFDSYYDQYRGVIAFIRVFSGQVSKGDLVWLLQSEVTTSVLEVGKFYPELKPVEMLTAGDIGYICTRLKEIRKVRVGDTIVFSTSKDKKPLPGYKKAKPMVYVSMFSVDNKEFGLLKDSLEKLYLTDSAIEFTQVYSKALGPGFRVGFLGVLHADIVRERIEKEFSLDIVLTPPQVEFKKEGVKFYEPYVKLTIVTPLQYLNSIIEICRRRRGSMIKMDSGESAMIEYEMPLSEMIGSYSSQETSFFEDVKTVSSGYASFDWEFLEYRETDADELQILLNNDPIEEFSIIVVKESAVDIARRYVERLKKLIPRQLFEVRIQAKFKGKIIASSRIPPYRRDVTAPLYGGDRTRKDKLLEKQKEGKKRLKALGKIQIPKEVFISLFKGSSS